MNLPPPPPPPKKKETEREREKGKKEVSETFVWSMSNMLG